MGNKKDDKSSDSGTGIAAFFVLTPLLGWPTFKRTQIIDLHYLT
jgi:hypothetical protein